MKLLIKNQIIFSNKKYYFNNKMAYVSATQLIFLKYFKILKEKKCNQCLSANKSKITVTENVTLYSKK